MPVIDLPYQSSSEKIFNTLRDLPFCCWLDSGKPASNYGRYDIITALPVKRIVTKGSTTSIYQVSGDIETLLYHHDGDPLKILQNELQELSSVEATPQALPFSGGAIGYFGYDLGRNYIGIRQKLRKANALPDMHIGIYQWAIIQDHHQQKAYLAYRPECDINTLEIIKKKLNDPYPNIALEPLIVKQLEKVINQDSYLQSLQQIDRYIHAGDCYQVNFAQCFQGSYTGDPYSAYSQLRSVMASPFSAFLSMGKQAIMSLSPERFLHTQGRKVLTQPIKGTAARNQSIAEDKKIAEKLHASEKNRAENLMIVDLLRNDLGKHCVPGSIKVNSLFGLQSFPNVHHLVSDISGMMNHSASSIDLLKACFPGGSITGAPKKRAMEIIDELEHQSRGVYCGSIAYINHNGDMDSNIAIRTVSCDGEKLYCWGGGGIVADSNAEEEYQESLDKINAILAILAKNR